MSVVSVNARSFILALFIRDDGERFLLGDNGYDFKDSQLHFAANTIENDEVVKQGTDGVMVAGQVRRSSVQSFDGFVGDATMAKETIEQMRRDFFAFFVKGHHFRVVYIDCNRNAWQRKGGYLVDAPEVKELWQIHPEYHVGLNFEDVNYYSYDEDASGEEILSNLVDVPVSTAASGGLVWDEDGAVSEDAEVEYITETAEASGRSISISDAAEAPLASFQLDGETSQNGTPTPSAPVAVNTVTGENVVKICGKNLLDLNGFVKGRLDNGVLGYASNTTALSVDGDSISFTTNANFRGITTEYIPVEPGGTYSTNIPTTGNYGAEVAQYDNSMNFISQVALSSEQTYGNTTNYVRIYLYLRSSGSATLDSLQLELGSATAYEPYKVQSYEVNLGKNMLTFGGSDVSGTKFGITYSYDAETQEWTFDGAATALADIQYPTGAGIDMHLDSGVIYTTTGFYQSGTISNGSVKLFQQDGTHGWQGITVTMSSASDNSEGFTPNTNLVLKDSHIIRIASGTVLSNFKVKFQTEKGLQATSYAPYFTPIELCKIGTYQDYIYKSGDKWYVHKECGKVNLSSITWESFLDTLKRSGENPVANMKYVANNQQVGFGLTEGFKIRQGSGLSVASMFGYFAIDTNRIAFNVGSGGSDPVGNLYYVLATPTDTEITNAALIEQLDNLASAALYSGTNNIFTITPNEVPTLEISYYTKYQPVVVGGGYVWEAGGTGGATVVVNNSIDNVSPIWKVYGPTLNPQLENSTTGETIEYVGMVGDGQTLTIDMGEQTASLDGLNVISDLVGDFISLAPGANRLIYSVTGDAGASEIGWSEIVG